METVNSLAWFSMDAAWMLQENRVAYVMIVPTVITGVLLCFMEKRHRSVMFINLAVLCWIGMNICWMLSETLKDDHLLPVAKSFFGAGVVFVFIAGLLAKNLLETFSHFRRFRVKPKSQN